MKAGRLGSALRRLGFPALDLVLPADCFCCRAPLGLHAALGACSACWNSFETLRPPLCSRCALPLVRATDLAGKGAPPCPHCARRPLPFVAAVACVAYGDTARAFVLRAKEGDRPELLWALGAQLLRRLEAQHSTQDWDLVLPIPSHPWGRLRRGFEPAAELARPLRKAGLPVRVRGLRRRWWPWASAKGMQQAARRRALGQAFEVRSPVHGQRVLLVDDVMTTGASGEACALRLLARGARAVGLAVWARTLPPGQGA